MRQLFTIDLEDYDPEWEKYYRPSVRGIIFDGDGNVAMIYSQKYHFFKFPGGGVEGDETHLETLAREIKEETGMTLIQDSAREFGEALRIQGGSERGNDTVLVQMSYYYTCRVADEIGDQELDDGEKEADFVLRFVPIAEAIAANSAFCSDDLFLNQMAERDKRVLEILRDENVVERRSGVK